MNEQDGRRHWVLIETGGNQPYIFGSNRLRHVTGASQVVHEVGTEWVAEAVRAVREVDLPPETVVMSASGKALLLVDREDHGRQVIRAVSDRALREAPGLQVTGTVGPGFDPGVPHRVSQEREDGTDQASGDDHVAALKATQVCHAEARAARPSPLLRDRLFPWHQPCRESGLPTARDELYGTDPQDGSSWHPASAGVFARSAAGPRARQRMAGILSDHADVIPKNLDELAHDGWIAVLHADGNGVGRLFLDFAKHIADAEGVPEVSLDLHVRYQKEIADQLDEATRAAVSISVGAVLDELTELGWSAEQLRGTFLPIVVGGDDVTVACHAALALPFVRHFTEAFTKQTAEQPTLSGLVGAAGKGTQEKGTQEKSAPAGLTASAGIAVVKPHHPFSAAYELAEELTSSAKRVTAKEKRDTAEEKGEADAADLPSLPSLDVHVAFESTLRPLAELRQPLTDPERSSRPVARHGGPYLLVEHDDPRLARCSKQDAHRLQQRRFGHLQKVLGWLGPDGWLSSARAHGLRDALDRSLPEYRQQLRLATGRARTELDRGGANDAGPATGVPADADALLGVQQAGDQRFLRLLDAMLLHGLSTRAAQPTDPARPTDDEVAEAAGTQAR